MRSDEHLDFTTIAGKTEDHCGPYLSDVFEILAAWNCYKRKDDTRALVMLLNAKDPVLAAAQVRYCHYWRWYKPEYASLEDLIGRSSWPESVKSWIISARPSPVL